MKVYEESTKVFLQDGQPAAGLLGSSHRSPPITKRRCLIWGSKKGKSKRFLVLSCTSQSAGEHSSFLHTPPRLTRAGLQQGDPVTPWPRAQGWQQRALICWFCAYKIIEGKKNLSGFAHLLTILSCFKSKACKIKILQP